MTREEMFRGQPWWVKTLWWSITTIMMLWLAPLLIAAIVNPLWFRQDLLGWIELHAGDLAHRRDHLLRPIFKKYRLLVTIKESC